MFPEPVSSIITVAAVVMIAVVLGVAVVRRVVRRVRLRGAPPSGLLRAGAPDGTDDPGVAARRAADRTAWTRMGGGL